MKRSILPLLVLPLVLSACAPQRMVPGAAFDRIDQELKDAAAAKANRGKKDEALSQAMMPPLQVDAPAVTLAEPRFDLAVNGAPAPQVFTALAAGSKYSMLVPPEVNGSLTLNLKGVTVREALEAIRDLYGFEFSIKGNRILIQPNTLQTRMFQINYLASRRIGQTDVRVTASSPTAASTPAANTPTTPGQPAPAGGSSRPGESSRVSTQSDSDFWKELTRALSAIVGEADGRSVIVNPLSGVVLVKALPSEMRSVQNYLKATQMVVDRQVMLEAKIVDVQLSEGYQSGINWSKFMGTDNRWTVGATAPGSTLRASGTLIGNAAGSGSTGVTTTPGGNTIGSLVASSLGKGFFGLAFQSKDFAALLSFLESQGDVQVLSSPRVATINNQKAVLKVGTDDFFVTNVSTTATSSGTGTIVTPTISLQPFFSGVALDVMPQIDDEGNVILHIHPSVSVVVEKTKVVDLGSTIGTFTLPLASSTVSEADSVVRVQDGNIVAIGGLMSESQTNDRAGLPGASRNSVLGGLFSQTDRGYRKRELVILLKPTVIQDDNTAWSKDLMDTQVRVQSYDPRRVGTPPQTK